MKKLIMGQKVIWNGGEAKYDAFDWLKKGMFGFVIKHQPEIIGTGRVLDYSDDGEPIVDEGIREYWTIDFGRAGLRCIDKEDINDRLIGEIE